MRKPSLSEGGGWARRSRGRHSDRGARRRNRKAGDSLSDGEVRINRQLSLRHGSLSIRRDEGGKTYLRAPSESPPFQYFCSARNAMMSGMTDTSAPMMMMPQRLAPPLLLPEA